MEDGVYGKEQLRLFHTPFGVEQRAEYTHLDRVHEELDDYLLLPSTFAPLLVDTAGTSDSSQDRWRPAGAAPRGVRGMTPDETANVGREEIHAGGPETAVSTVLLVGDQNAGKTSFLFCFSRNLFRQQLQLSSYLPVLRASFVNARLLFISPTQLLHMQQAAEASTPSHRAVKKNDHRSDVSTLETEELIDTAPAGAATAPGRTTRAAYAAAGATEAAARAREEAAAAGRTEAAAGGIEAAAIERGAAADVVQEAAGTGEAAAGVRGAAADAGEGAAVAAGAGDAMAGGAGVPGRRAISQGTVTAALRSVNSEYEAYEEGFESSIKSSKNNRRENELRDSLKSDGDSRRGEEDRDSIRNTGGSRRQELRGSITSEGDSRSTKEELHSITSSEDTSDEDEEVSGFNKRQRDLLLSIARDVTPFLDSDVARAVVLFTLEDFLFFCDESGLSSASNDGASSGIRRDIAEAWGDHRYNGNTAEESQTTFPAFLEASRGVRYVAIHLLEFGGDHLDRILRFFQFLRIQLNQHKGQWRCPCNMESSLDTNAHRICSSSINMSDSNSNRESSEITDRSCSRDRGSTGSYGYADGCNNHRCTEVYRVNPFLDSCHDKTDTTFINENSKCTLCWCTDDHSNLWRIATGRGTATERVIAVAAAYQMLAEEQQQCFYRLFYAKTLCGHLRSRAVAKGGSLNATPVSEGSYKSMAATADPATSRDFPESSAAHAERNDPCAHDAAAVNVDVDEEKSVHSSAANAFLIPTWHSIEKTSTTPAREADTTAVTNAAKERRRQSLELLKVLRRSAQLLSEATHTLYFINCRSLMPSLHPCTRLCCRYYSEKQAVGCFLLDPSALTAFINRLRALALIHQCSRNTPRPSQSDSRRIYTQQVDVGSSARCPTCSINTSTGTSHNIDRSDSSCNSSSSDTSNSHSTGTSNSRCRNSHSRRQPRNGWGPSDDQCQSCVSGARARQPLSKRRQQITFVCSRLPDPGADAAGPTAVSPDTGGTNAASGKKLLEGCCRLCMRENFRTAMQVLRASHTWQLHQRRKSRPQHGSPSENSFLTSQKHHRWLQTSLATEEEDAFAASDTATVAAQSSTTNFRGQSPEASVAAATATSTVVHFPKGAETQKIFEAARDISPNILKACAATATAAAAASWDTSGSLDADRGDRACYCVATEEAAADDDDDKEGPETPGFRLFMQLVKEAAAAAAVAATRSESNEVVDREEDEELAAAAADEVALRGSPRFLFIHALLHYMWAWPAATADRFCAGAAWPTAAGIPAGAAASSPRGAALLGLPLLDSQSSRTGDSVPIGDASFKAGSPFSNEHVETMAEATDTEASSMHQLPTDRAVGGREASGEASGLSDTATYTFPDRSACTEAGKFVEQGRPQAILTSHPSSSTLNADRGSPQSAQKNEATEGSAGWQSIYHLQEKEAAETSARRQLFHDDQEKTASKRPAESQEVLAHPPGYLQVISSAIQLQAILPVQLLEGADQQQRLQGTKIPQQPSREQKQQQPQGHTGVEEKVFLASPHGPVQQERQANHQEQQKRVDLQHQDMHISTERDEQPNVSAVSFQDEHQEEEEKQRKEPRKTGEETALLQPPFRVGAVVNLFATLLRLGCLPRQKEVAITRQRAAAQGYIGDQQKGEADDSENRIAATPIGASAALTADPSGGLPAVVRPGRKACRGLSVISDVQQNARGGQHQPSTEEEEEGEAEAGGNAEIHELSSRDARHTALDVADGRGAVMTPTGELGRQLLLMFLKLLRKQRQSVCTEPAWPADEAEVTDSLKTKSVILKKMSSLQPLRNIAVLNIWFSLLDAIIMLNDETNENDACSSDDVHAKKQSGIRRGRWSTRINTQSEGDTDAAAVAAPVEVAPHVEESAAAVPYADEPSISHTAASSSQQHSASTASDMPAGLRESASARRTPPCAQQVCQYFEGIYKRLEHTEISAGAYEGSFLPSSTFIQLLPSLFEGLTWVSAASPYDPFAAPFPPVLLELRWVHESLSSSAAGPCPVEKPTVLSLKPAKASSSSLTAVAAEHVPSVADFHVSSLNKAFLAEEPHQLPSASVTSSAAAGGTLAESPTPATQAETLPAAGAALFADAETGPRSSPTVKSSMTEHHLYGQRATSPSTELTTSGGHFRGYEVGSSATAGDLSGPSELKTFQTYVAVTSPVTLDTTKATILPACSSPSLSERPDGSCYSSPAVSSGHCVTLTLAPARLLQQQQCALHSKSPPKPFTTCGQRVKGSEPAEGGRRERRLDAATKPLQVMSAAARSSGNSEAYRATTAENDRKVGVANGAREHRAIRMALQEHLFNFIYYSLQQAVCNGPLPIDFWERDNCVLWEECNQGSSDASPGYNTFSASANFPSRSFSRRELNSNNRQTASCSHNDVQKSEARFVSSSTSASLGHTSTPTLNSCKVILPTRTTDEFPNTVIAGETCWLDCVKQCVLDALYTHIQHLCGGLHRYAHCIATSCCSFYSPSSGDAATPAATGALRRLEHRVSTKEAVSSLLQPTQPVQTHVQFNKQDGEQQDTDDGQQKEGELECLREADKRYPTSRSVADVQKTRPTDRQHMFSLAAFDDDTQKVTSAAAEIAAAAHVLLQLAGDMVLLERIVGCVTSENAFTRRFNGGSCEGKQMLNGRETTDAKILLTSRAAAIMQKQNAVRAGLTTLVAGAATSTIPQASVRVMQAPLSPPPTWQQAASAVEAVPSDATAGGPQSSLVTTDTTLVTARDTVTNRSLPETCEKPTTYRRSDTRAGNSLAKTIGVSHWWVTDEASCPSCAPYKKVVVEISTERCVGLHGVRSLEDSAALMNLRLPCDPTASLDVYPPQKQAEVLAACAQALRISHDFVQQQDEKARQNSSRKAVKGGDRNCVVAEEDTSIFPTRYLFEDSPPGGDDLNAVPATLSSALRTKAARSWLKLLCRLEEDENISLSIAP